MHKPEEVGSSFSRDRRRCICYHGDQSVSVLFLSCTAPGWSKLFRMVHSFRGQSKSTMSGRGRGAYYKARYGGGGRSRRHGQGHGSARGQGQGFRNQYRRDSHGGRFTNEQNSSIQGKGPDLKSALLQLDGASYGAYKQLIGGWTFDEGWELWIDSVQSDPYAPPSRFRARIPFKENGGWPTSLFTEKRIRWVAACDFILRKFWNLVRNEELDVSLNTGGGWGSAKGGALNIEKPGQCVLERSACQVLAGKWLELRFTVSLPARGRTILGRQAAELVCTQLPPVLRETMFYDRYDRKSLQSHVVCAEDQEYIRSTALSSFGLIAFVGNGSILPRRSGADDRPMRAEEVVPFASPSSLEISLNLPSGKEVKGMGIKAGVTLITGGGFHGKSTLLSSLEHGVYNHIPKDGREYVSTCASAMSIRAEDGRSIVGVDISSFIDNLPFGKKTDTFTTQDASGSTSQAANIVEAVAAGAKALIVDEDLAATNFMIRDEKIQRLVHPEKEPITPFLHRVRALFEQYNVSSVLVIGGAGDYFSVADTVIMMDSYESQDVTERAHSIASEHPNAQQKRVKHDLLQGIEKRAISSGSILEVANSGRGKVRPQALRTITFGNGELDLASVRQIVERGQTQALADAAVALGTAPSMNDSLTKAIQVLDNRINETGLDAVNPRGEYSGSYARPRQLEIAAAVNRIRGIRAILRKR